MLWEALRGRRLGVTFRRQFVIDRYIVDLYCAARRRMTEVLERLREALHA
jgi:very-short-patch-repair endonuclease